MKKEIKELKNEELGSREGGVRVWFLGEKSYADYYYEIVGVVKGKDGVNSIYASDYLMGILHFYEDGRESVEWYHMSENHLAPITHYEFRDWDSEDSDDEEDE